MSALYPDLSLTNFPSSLDQFMTFLNIVASDGPLIAQYQAAMESGNQTQANQILAQIPQGTQKIITATDLNTLSQAMLAVERFYLTDIEPYVKNLQQSWLTTINQFSYQGVWQSGTSYVTNNLVSYTVSGLNLVYIALSNVPVGTAPTNQTYWRLLTIQGQTGASGTGLSYRQEWNNSVAYSTNDAVTHDGSLWMALQPSQNREPSSSPQYWQLVMSLETTTYPIQDTEPANLQVEGLWFNTSNNPTKYYYLDNLTNPASAINIESGFQSYDANGNLIIGTKPSSVHIYGVEWDWTSSGNTKGVRTDDAASFGDPNPAVVNGTGSSPFDNLYPWSEMGIYNRIGGTMVKEPKYWFKWTRTPSGSGVKLKLQIADGPVDGFYVDPVNMDRGDGLGELDFSFIGRYHCAEGTYRSETNKAQQVSITRSVARTNIHNLGANVWQIDFAQMWYIGMLYLVEFADWNGQTAIGYGCSSGHSKQNNGQTDSMQYHTGTTAANRTTYGFTQYRNIEGWWDNVYDWMDGCYYNSNGLNVIKNPAQFSDSANGVLVGQLPGSGGYPSDLAIPTQDGMEWALYPSAVNGSQTTYVPDGWYYVASTPCLCHGSSDYWSLQRGPFYVYYSGASNASANTGCRLQERPPKS